MATGLSLGPGGRSLGGRLRSIPGGAAGAGRRAWDVSAGRHRQRPGVASRHAPPPPAGGGSVLVLSASIGEGHNALATGCAVALRSAGMTTELIDVLQSLGPGPGAAAERIFRRLLSCTPVYDAFHFSQLRDGGRISAAAERSAVTRATPVVSERLGRATADMALSVFATGAGVASRLKSEGRCRRSVVFIPDSCAHRMWVHDNTDLFLVTSRLGAASVRRYRPGAPVRVVVPPLREEFFHPPSRHEARSALEVPLDASCVLIMGGGWGLGPVMGLSEALAGAGHHVIAVAGRNEALLGRLRALSARQPRLRPVGFTDTISKLMAAADLVVTTPGMTCREARAVGRGLVLLDAVPGHGRENLDHELEQGAAAVSQIDPRSVTATVAACLEDDEFRSPPRRLHPTPAMPTFLQALYEHDLLGDPESSRTTSGEETARAN